MPSSAVLFDDFDQRLIDIIIVQLREANADRATTDGETEHRRVRIARYKQTLMDLLYVKAVSGYSPTYF